MENQNLHGLSEYPNYIVTAPTFLPYAQELAQYRSNEGLDPLVVTQEQIFNEFSGGVTDPSAIRDFLNIFGIVPWHKVSNFPSIFCCLVMLLSTPKILKVGSPTTSLPFKA